MVVQKVGLANLGVILTASEINQALYERLGRTTLLASTCICTGTNGGNLCQKRHQKSDVVAQEEWKKTSRTPLLNLVIGVTAGLAMISLKEQWQSDETLTVKLLVRGCGPK